MERSRWLCWTVQLQPSELVKHSCLQGAALSRQWKRSASIKSCCGWDLSILLVADSSATQTQHCRLTGLLLWTWRCAQDCRLADEMFGTQRLSPAE